MRRRARGVSIEMDATLDRETDVCILVEGCYPYVPGGVSSWIDWLIRSQPDLSFSIVCLWPRPTSDEPRYALPPNVLTLQHLYLQHFGAQPPARLPSREVVEGFAADLAAFMRTGGADALDALMGRLGEIGGPDRVEALFNSPVAWDLAQRMYASEMPYGSFLHFFWAWRALAGGLLATLVHGLPRAKVYHTISTGYAGVLAARASRETGRPALLTEHGIYTNERRIELLMADWVADTVDKGHAIDDPRFDLRDMWIRSFEAYARTCYESCAEVITLFGENQIAQRGLGAAPARSRVIANGIDIARFSALPLAPASARPTLALIGRVVPIKDVRTFLSAVAAVHERIPTLRALILGPLDEDPEYVAACRSLAAALRLDGVVEFTGAVNIIDYLPQVHVVVLTSLSESQPLVILEAGAAGIPFVATDVGSCREIIEGRANEQPPLGPGGIVTGLVAPEEIARALERFLTDADLRRSHGEALRERISRYYRSEQATEAYRHLYRRHIEAPTRPRGGREAA